MSKHTFSLENCPSTGKGILALDANVSFLVDRAIHHHQLRFAWCTESTPYHEGATFPSISWTQQSSSVSQTRQRTWAPPPQTGGVIPHNWRAVYINVSQFVCIFPCKISNNIFCTNRPLSSFFWYFIEWHFTYTFQLLATVIPYESHPYIYISNHTYILLWHGLVDAKAYTGPSITSSVYLIFGCWLVIPSKIQVLSSTKV